MSDDRPPSTDNEAWSRKVRQVEERLRLAVAERDRLRAQAEELAHALHHVVGCPMGCADCRKVAGSALAHENLADFQLDVSPNTGGES